MHVSSVIFVLVLTASNIYRLKYKNNLWIIIAEFVLVIAASFINPVFSILFALTAYEFTYKKFYIGLAGTALSILHPWGYYPVQVLFLTASICSIYAYSRRILEEKEDALIKLYDSERHMRYQLESANLKLLNSSKEIAHIAEVKERNRIAREIHDNIGHNIAGVLINLQAAFKIHDRDAQKSMELVKKCIDSMSDALTLIRNTVHNIRPKESIGIEYINDIIRNFTFCPVEFKHSGDFNSLPANHMEILGYNIKEALTNAAKHSKANKIIINIDINEKFTRLYIKDNGVGCTNIKENMGISGMKERVRNAGGTITFDSANGFLIVCVIPREKELGGGLFESIGG
mgnify:FL=1